MKEIKVFATFREVCDGKTIRIPYKEGQSIDEILADVTTQFPEMEEELFTDEHVVRQHVHVFINGRNIIHLNGLETEVKPEDQLALFPPVAGG